MPEAVKVRQHYKDKDVVFVYISSDKNLANWKQAMTEHGLEGLENYVETNPAESAYLISMSISSILRYVLYGRNGELLESMATRVNDPKVYEMLDKYL